MHHVQDLIRQTMSCMFQLVHASQQEPDHQCCIQQLTISTWFWRNLLRVWIAMVLLLLHWQTLSLAPPSPTQTHNPSLPLVETLVLFNDKFVLLRLATMLVLSFLVTTSPRTLPCWREQSWPPRKIFISVSVSLSHFFFFFPWIL